MLYYSENLYKILESIKHTNKVANYLIGMEGSRDSNYTFLDCDKSKDPILIYYKTDQVLNILGDKSRKELRGFKYRFSPSYYRKFFSEKHHLLSSKKECIRIGKYVKSLNIFSDTEIEEFVNIFKSKKAIIDNEIISIVSGDDIKKWYNIDNYQGGSWSMLHNSCMSRVDSKFFEMYSKNPDKCRMVIITKNSKLIARALLWKLDKPLNGCEYYMDRIYSIEDRLKYKMTQYASENKWCYRINFYNGSEKQDVIANSRTYINPKLKVSLPNYRHEFYPYMDTFKRLNYNGILYNDKSYKKMGKILEGTSGNYDIVRTILGIFDFESYF